MAHITKFQRRIKLICKSKSRYIIDEWSYSTKTAARAASARVRAREERRELGSCALVRLDRRPQPHELRALDHVDLVGRVDDVGGVLRLLLRRRAPVERAARKYLSLAQSLSGVLERLARELARTCATHTLATLSALALGSLEASTATRSSVAANTIATARSCRGLDGGANVKKNTTNALHLSGVRLMMLDSHGCTIERVRPGSACTRAQRASRLSSDYRSPALTRL